ncbi:tetratricopeptide repeat protein [Kovacikia minuta CCNUW1]|uniref:tetratricopeptide repeat protein n=1 Tax=Kovacikia minuta TaxID=2931930 RepID=UPI001CCF9CF2|nr:tetratricopeptide repeat protein [Kovacikia minuta]UBF24695.1 tetratricopeptide repeat protein [Kovacikia minuta CCNUW1]
MKDLRNKLGWLLLVGCLTLASLGGVAAQAQPVPAAVSEGYALLKRGWVNDAIAAFQQALRQNPKSLDARLGLALAYQRAGQDANAWQTYQQVLAQDPNNRTALTAVGVLGSYRPEWQAEGIAALTTLLQLTPKDTNARAQRALLLGYQGLFGESLADYQLLLQNNPTPEVILGAAQVYTYSGNYTQALTLFDRYRATGRSLPDNAITAYALTLQETGQAAQAVQILEAQLKQRKSLDERSIELRAALARAYQANGQSEAALTVLEPLRGQPKATLARARALSAIARKEGNSQRYQEAIDLYRQALNQTPNPSPGLITEVADVLSEQAATQSEALQLYQQLAQQQPNDQSLIVKRLILSNQLGQLSRTELRQQLQTILQSLPVGVAERQAIAIALIRLDPPDPELLSLYQTLVQSDVDVPFLHFRIAQMQIQKGDLASAKQALAAYRATPTGSQDLATELLLAEIERRESNLEASAQRYEAIIARNPPSAVLQNALFGLANIRRSQGRLEEVVRIYTDLLTRNPQDARAQIGLINLNYQLKRISTVEAEAKLEEWLNTHSPLEPYPELFSLVGALPPDPNREQLYTTLLALDPNNIAVERRLIQVIALRDPAEARRRVDQVLARDRTRIDSYFVQGELAQALGDFELANQAYQTILQQQPDNVDALSALAGVRFQQKRYQEAEVLYRRVLVLRPNDLETQRILADLYLAQDRPTAAFQQLRQIQQIQIANGTQDAAIAERIQDIQLNFLRRRGFQPSWERY